MRPPTRGAGRRRGGALIEMALVCPIAVLLILGALALGLEVFRYQQLEALSREAARWAAVRGERYQDDHNQPAPTPATLMDEVLAPRLAGLDPAALTCTLSMSGGVATVELSYRRDPLLFLPAVVLRRGASAPISY